MASPPSRLLERVRPVYKPLYFLISLNGEKNLISFLSFLLRTLSPFSHLKRYSHMASTPSERKGHFFPLTSGTWNLRVCFYLFPNMIKVCVK